LRRSRSPEIEIEADAADWEIRLPAISITNSDRAKNKPSAILQKRLQTLALLR
jgi:hypothetical protein